MSTTKSYSWSTNKVLYSTNLFKWITYFTLQKDTTVITPLTKVSDLLKLKAGSELHKAIVEHEPEGIDKLVHQSVIAEVINKLNERLGAEVLLLDLGVDGLLKALFDVNAELLVTPSFLGHFFAFVNLYAPKMQTFVVVGLDVPRMHHNMVSVHVLTSYLKGLMHYHNLEELIMLDYEGLDELVDRDKFLSWLELRTRTVLTPTDLENYFSDEVSMNSFLIDKALRELK